MAEKNLTELLKDKVDGNLIGDGQVDTVDLANDAVNGDKIEDLAVDTEHLASGAVTIDKMDTDSVGSDQIVNLSVTSSKLNNTGLVLQGYSTNELLKQMRNIYLNTGEPDDVTHGIDGDVWIQYSL